MNSTRLYKRVLNSMMLIMMNTQINYQEKWHHYWVQAMTWIMRMQKLRSSVIKNYLRKNTGMAS